ncbi:MAG: hypothetical protein JKY96_08495 [Phycisphaerales bacterium]|nr:hypothetical protein [Phycisphaerales bacterium]
MKYTRTTTVTILSAAALTLASGCAQDRSSSLSSDTSVRSSYQSQQPSTPQSAHTSDLVIGTDLAFEGVPTYDRPATELSLAEIANELIAMHNRDRQLVRSSIDPSQQDPQAVARVSAIDHAHTARLREIVDYIGWPTRGTVGLEATEGAFLVVQHAGNDTAFQSRCLAMLHDLADRGQLPKPYVALLTDRIRVFNDQPQLYGTQMTLAKDTNGVMRPIPSSPIHLPEELDARRAKMGMPAHGKFVTAIAQAYAASLVEPNERFASVETE